VQNSGVVPASEVASDFFEAVAGEGAGQEHAYLSWQGDGLASLLTLQIGQPYIVIIGNGVDNLRDGDGPGDVNFGADGALSQFKGDFLACGLGGGVDDSEGAFEFADVGLDLAGDVLGDGFGDFEASEVGLFLHDCDSCFVAGRIEACDEAPFESADKAFLERGQLCGCAVGGEDDLFAVVVERVECVEEFFLAVLPLAEELDVVDNEHVNGAAVALKLWEGSFFDCGDEGVYELFAAQEADEGIGEFFLCFAADGVEEMCFSESDAAVEKQRVVCCSGCVADGDAACVCEPVCRSDDEVFKCVIGMHFYGPGRLGGGV